MKKINTSRLLRFSVDYRNVIADILLILSPFHWRGPQYGRASFEAPKVSGQLEGVDIYKIVSLLKKGKLTRDNLVDRKIKRPTAQKVLEILDTEGITKKGRRKKRILIDGTDLYNRLRSIKTNTDSAIYSTLSEENFYNLIKKQKGKS